MSWLITICTAAGRRTYPVIGDLAAHIAGLSDDEAMGVTAMVAP
jgi:hypothetical protein